MEYRLLGTMEVSRSGSVLSIGGTKQRAVLAVLLLAADSVVSFDRLIALVWDDAPPPKAAASLRAYVANLRRLLESVVTEEPRRLVTTPCGYRLELGADSLDVRMFEALVTRGRAELARGDAAGAQRSLLAAEELWRGRALADFRDAQFAFAESERLDAIRLDATEARFEAGLRVGLDRELITDLEAQVAAHPLRERLWAQLMLALYRAERPVDALLAYDRVRAVLHRELGVSPGAALRDLADGIRCGAKHLNWSPEPAVVRSGGPRLCGRERELALVDAVLDDALAGYGQLVVVTGGSGAGKSALLTAAAERARARGFGSATADSAGGDRPQLVVVDDLHRSPASVRTAVEALAASIAARPIVIVVAWSDGGVGEPVRRSAFDRLLGRAPATVIELRALPAPVLADLVRRAGPASDAVVGGILARSGGTAFYVRELARSAGEGVPEAVASAVRRRLAELPRPTRAALATAALVGPEARVAVLARALGTDAGTIADQLEPARRDGFVSALPGHYRFRIPLERDAVAAALSTRERLRLHALLAECVDEADAAADHAWLAGPELAPAVTVALLDRAAQAAARRGAHDEAAALARKALDACAVPVDARTARRPLHRVITA